MAMKVRFAALLLCAGLLVPAPASAKDPELEVTAQTLNRLVGRLGALSDAGTYRPIGLDGPATPGHVEPCVFVGFLLCPGVPEDLGFGGSGIPLVLCPPGEAHGFSLIFVGPRITWQWWVTGAHYTLSSGSMSFTATVRTRSGDQTDEVTRTVPASVSFDSNTDRIRINLGAFTVPLRKTVAGQQRTLTSVDVAKLFSISIPIGSQEIVVHRPTGGTRKITARVLGVTPQYLSGKIRIEINLEF